jgi:hypothetical protein
MRFIDEITVKTPIYPASNVVKLKSGSGATSHSLDDLDAMLEDYQRTGEGWHNCMLTCTASYVARKWDDDAITTKLGPYCWRGAVDPDLLELVRSARAKFGPKSFPAALTAVLKPDSQAEPAPAREETEAPPEPADRAPLAAKIAWLLATHGHNPKGSRVVELYEADSDCLIKMTDFRDAFAHWYEMQIGPLGGQNKATAVAGWLVAKRLIIKGVRMAPDRDFPVYSEGKHWFKNTYRRPRHEGSGDVAPFLAFLTRLIPDQRSRDYKLDWMAHKLRHPEIPGCAIMHVADNDQSAVGAREGSYGTGRGILFSIARALFGDAYCSEQDFRILDGSSPQSVYTDWQHGSVLVTCDESPSSPTYYRRAERVVAYEILKRIIDPAVTQRTFTGKYKGAFAGRSHCSIWVATNHIDALAIPANDRRISVIRNGAPPTRAEIADIVVWRGKAGSLAALEAFLLARDIAGFNAYEPIWTDAKASMVEASVSEVEETMLEIMADEERGLVFLRDDLFNAVRAQHNQGETVSGHFQDAWRRHVVKAVDGSQSQRRMRIGSTQRKLFCFRCMAEQVTGLTEEEARAEALRWRPGIGSMLGLGSR